MRLLLSLLIVSIAAVVLAQESCIADPAGSLCPMSTTTREASSSLSPRQCNEPTVQCFADPCSIRPEASSTCSPVTCEASYCGGCIANWFDANNQPTCRETTCDPSQCGPAPAIATMLCSDGKTTSGVGNCVNKGSGCAWEITTCPIVCPVPSCTTDCKLGYKNDQNGCMTCECLQAEVCPAVLCAQVNEAECFSKNGRLVNNGCCTTCELPPLDCSAVLCIAAECPVPTAGQQTFVYTPPGSCCPKCDIINCAAVLCSMPLCEEGYEIQVPPGQCCPTCVAPPECKDVACAAIYCDPIATENGNTVLQQASVPDGQCCPSCNPIPDCSAVLCAQPQCGPDQEIITRAGECCPTCQDNNWCSRVLCAQPNCPIAMQEKRPGTCCPTCSYCRQVTEAESTGIVCTAAGQPVCDPAFAGLDCQTPMPANQYSESCFEVTVSVNSAAWADLSSNTNCKYSVIAELQDDVPILAQHPENFACTVVSGDGDRKTVRLCVRVAAGDTVVNAESVAPAAQQSLLNSVGVNSGSAALSLAVAALFAVAALLLF